MAVYRTIPITPIKTYNIPKFLKLEPYNGYKGDVRNFLI